MNGNRAMNWIKNNEMVETQLIQVISNSTYLCARVTNIERKMFFTWKTIKYFDAVDFLGITLDKNMKLESHDENI